MEKLENDLSEKQKVDAKCQSNVSHKKEALKAEQKKLKDLKKQQDNVRRVGLPGYGVSGERGVGVREGMQVGMKEDNREYFVPQNRHMNSQFNSEAKDRPRLFMESCKCHTTWSLFPGCTCSFQTNNPLLET